MATYAPVQRASVVDVATANLRRVLLDGEVEVGEKLPPERLLAEKLGVHRGTLRCALNRLEAEGLVQARHGSGYEVLDFLKTGTTSLIGPLIERSAAPAQRHQDARDLLLLRRHLAAALFEHLRRDAEALSFEKAYAAIDTLAEVSPDAEIEVFARADLNVVSALVECAKSPVLSLCLHPVSTVLLSWPALMQAMYRERDQNVERWRLVVTWLADAEPSLDQASVMQMLAAFDAQTLEAFSPAAL